MTSYSHITWVFQHMWTNLSHYSLDLRFLGFSSHTPRFLLFFVVFFLQNMKSQIHNQCLYQPTSIFSCRSSHAKDRSYVHTGDTFYRNYNLLQVIVLNYWLTVHTHIPLTIITKLWRRPCSERSTSLPTPVVALEVSQSPKTLQVRNIPVSVC